MATMSVQHPGDKEHPLIFGELSENCRIPCHLCELRLSGPTYCCWDCGIFLHKSCAEEFPLKVNYSRHSEHPILSLAYHTSRNFYFYQCDTCSSCFDLWSVVMAMNYLEEEENMIHHFTHIHPLTSFNLKALVKVKCELCKLRISGPIYLCLDCKFFLHESCARLPKVIEQPHVHPQHKLTLTVGPSFNCTACDSSFNRLFDSAHHYQYDDCDIRLDVRCVNSAMPSQKEDCVRIDHFSHEHSLASFSMETMDILCRACKKYLSGDICGCPGCIFFLHKSCLEELPREIIHFLHPDHPLVFRPKPQYDGGKFYWNACSVGCRGFVFTCEICQFNLDPVCALQTLAALEEGAAAEITHFSHDHQLTLYGITSLGDEESADDDPDYCEDCRGPLKGLAYRCLSYLDDERNDSFMVHKHCAELPRKLEHPLHPQHPLTLQPSRDSCCVASRLITEGPTYCCEECQFFLSAKAALLNPTLKHQPHEHDLTYFDKCGRDPCNYCGKRCNVDSYLCIVCNFNVHYSCIRRLPLSIKHDCHFHPLVLRDKHVIPYFEEQYCDACENTRRPDRAVYFCEECQFAAHIGCVIPWVQIEGTDLDGLNRQIENLEAKVEETERNLEAYKEELMGLKAKKEALLC